MTRSRYIGVAACLALFAVLLMFVLPAARGAEDEAPPADEGAAPEEAVERDAPAAPDAAAAAEDQEPPLEFALEVGGKAVDVQLDRPATVEVDGKKVEVRLTAKPDRLFRGGGVSFRYPRDHAFEVEREPGGDGAATWTFDGSTNVLVLLRNAEPVDPEELRRDIVESMSEQYGKANCRTAPTTIALGDLKVSGTRVDVRVAGEHIVQDVFAWQAKDGDEPTYAMIVQDTPPAPGEASDETRQVRDLLAKTFKHEAAPKE